MHGLLNSVGVEVGFPRWTSSPTPERIDEKRIRKTCSQCAHQSLGKTDWGLGVTIPHVIRFSLLSIVISNVDQTVGEQVYFQSVND